MSRVGDRTVRPHDIALGLEPSHDAVAAEIERVVHLGFEVRVEARLPGGDHVTAQLSRAEARRLALEEGQTVYVLAPVDEALERVA